MIRRGRPQGQASLADLEGNFRPTDEVGFILFLSMSSSTSLFWSFINSIYSTPVRGFEEDKRYWLPCKRKGFTVRAYYHLLIGHSEQSFPWKSIWKQKIPSRVAFFVWTAALGKCLTIDNLRKRKVCILNWCYMCKCNSESVNHLFLHCTVASELWDMVFGLFGVNWVMPLFVVGLFACWQGH